MKIQQKLLIQVAVVFLLIFPTMELPGQGTGSVPLPEYIRKNHKEVLQYLKSRFPMYHQSNFFFRDVQYGIQAMFREKGSKVRSGVAEKLARDFLIGYLGDEGNELALTYERTFIDAHHAPPG